MTPQEFYDLCEKHNWYYMRSDDHTAYKKGERERAALRHALGKNISLRNMFEQWLDYKFIDNKPKPVRPE